MGSSGAQEQRIEESTIFSGFVKASGLPAEHFANDKPPFPDIRAVIFGTTYYFELGEITDQGLAWATADALKTGEITGCAFSQLDPLLRMFRNKCAARYNTNGAPVDLILYYSKQRPYEPLLYEHLKAYADEMRSLIANSQFSRIWLYRDCRPQNVLWSLER